MTFLPIVQRELRTAARQPSTYRTRTRFAFVTSLIAGVLLLTGRGGSGTQMGTVVFPLLAMLAFCYCLIAGVRYTADSLSEEKREGTLGLLFLTDLRGYDVVLGKLMSVAARTFQGLFAFLPVLAIGLLIGGVSGWEFWRAAAVLTNTLFFSLSVGLWASSLSRESHAALAVAAGALLFVTGAPLGADALLSAAGWGHSALVSFASPGAAVRLLWDDVYEAHPLRFWAALLANHLFGWSFLFFASVIVPRSWQERTVTPTASSQVKAGSVSGPQIGSERRLAFRRRLLDINPIYWLAARHERHRALLWMFVATVAIGGTGALLLGYLLAGRTFGAFWILSASLGLVLKLWIAWQACATLAEARRTGAVELLLATPLKVDEIIHGHWQALQRFFLWPAVATVALTALPVIEALITSSPWSDALSLLPIPGMTLFGMATFLLDLVALAWVGMWMGITQPKSIQAFAKTILFVMIIPGFLCLPNILFDLFWICWARQNLEKHFRLAAADRYAPGLKSIVWLWGPKSAVVRPPVIAGGQQCST